MLFLWGCEKKSGGAAETRFSRADLLQNAREQRYFGRAQAIFNNACGKVAENAAGKWRRINKFDTSSAPAAPRGKYILYFLYIARGENAKERCVGED